MSALTLHDVSKQFGDVAVLSNLDITVDEGEVFGLLGPNGAGKTTTINILTGVVAPDAGTADVLGADPTTDPVAVRNNVGVLPEKESPPHFLTPNEYFSFVGGVRNLDADRVDTRVAEWAQRLSTHASGGYADKLDTLCKDLSRGQQQKTMLIQTFLHDPDLVFIDEPLANLDPLMQDEVKQFITDYHNDGNTMVLSTHHLEVAADLCTRVGILHDGEIVATHRPQDSDTSLRTVFRDAVATDTQEG